MENICNIVGTSHNHVNRTNLYKTLALIAWAQQGKVLSDKLFENCVSKGMYRRELLNNVINSKKFSLLQSFYFIEIHYYCMQFSCNIKWRRAALYILL